MTADPQRRLTVEEYLAFERQSETRHEYLGGEVFAMSGASREHNLISTNLVGALHPQCRSQGCELYSNDMRVKIPATGLYTYIGQLVPQKEVQPPQETSFAADMTTEDLVDIGLEIANGNDERGSLHVRHCTKRATAKQGRRAGAAGPRAMCRVKP